LDLISKASVQLGTETIVVGSGRTFIWILSFEGRWIPCHCRG